MPESLCAIEKNSLAGLACLDPNATDFGATISLVFDFHRETQE